MKRDRDIVVQIGTNKVDFFNIKRRLNRCWCEKLIQDDKNEIYLRNKKLHLILQDEKILIKLINIPLVKRDLMYKTVKNELEYALTYIEDIIFDFEIMAKNKNSYDILVYCIKVNKMDLLRKYVERNNRIIKVNLIQFCVYEYYKQKIIDENFIFTFQLNNKYYCLLFKDSHLISNITCNKLDNTSEEIKQKFLKFKNDNKESFKFIEKIFCVNIDSSEEVNVISNKKIVDLGLLKNEQLINAYYKQSS